LCADRGHPAVLAGLSCMYVAASRMAEAADQAEDVVGSQA